MQITAHANYTKTQEEVTTIRDAVAGQYAVKAKERTYLPHPTRGETESKDAKQLYAAFLAGAEFDEYPTNTLDANIGKLSLKSTQIELPERLQYLENDCDGDGLSLIGLLTSCASNVMQVGYHVLVVDYKGLTDVDATQLSLADIQAIKPRATIKQYSRENVINWSFSRKSGVLQLDYIVLREIATDFDPNNMTHNEIKSFIILALDEEGRYYQQKVIEGKSGQEEGERNYVMVGGQPLTWLPVQIVSDDTVSGDLPMGFGILSPIVNLTYARYRMSAVYKATLAQLAPTIMTRGWMNGDMDLFEEVNKRDYIVTGLGGVNNLPNSVEVEIVSSGVSLEPMEKYFAENLDKIKQLGGVVSQTQTNKTATQVETESADQKAQLDMIANAIETSVKQCLLYCGMFEGLWSPDGIEMQSDDIVLQLSREFTKVKMPIEQARMLLDLDLAGKLPEGALLELLHKGNLIDADIAELMNGIDNNA